MIKRLLASTILLFVLIHTSVYALDFSYHAGISNTGEHKYKAVKLTSEIYNKIKPNMADLMLYDKDNEPVPYFMNSFVESETEMEKSYEMRLINSFIKEEYFYFDYTLKDTLQEDITATSIEVETGKDSFAKDVEIFGGYDNVNWERIQEDILYHVGGNKKLGITFDSIKKYTYYRFKISNNLEKVTFSSVSLKYNQTVQEKEYFSNAISPDFSTEERGNRTVIKIQDLKNLKLSSIALITQSTFKREVTFNGIESKMLYNLEFERTAYRDLTIPIHPYRVITDIVEVVIDNKDDKPIEILGIEAKYLVDELIFDGSKSNEYTLWFGNNEIQSPKSYDISNYKEQIINEGYDILTLNEIKEEMPKVPDKPQYDYRLIFNITILIIAVLIGVLIFFKLKK